MVPNLTDHAELTNNPSLMAGTTPVIAHGDSWFSIGSFPPPKTSSILLQLDLATHTTIINYAYPGQELQHMPTAKHYPNFVKAMTLKGMPAWKAILVSGGGNDLIAWMGKSPLADAKQRILLRKDEWSNGPHASRYLSDKGWTGLCTQLMQAYQKFASLRAKSSNPSAPIITHCYDFAEPRPAGAGLGIGPWLMPKLALYEIPAKDWGAVVEELLLRFKTFLEEEVADTIPDFLIVPTQGTLKPAPADSDSPSADWVNEIHPTKKGYKKIAAHWSTALDDL